MSTKAIVRVENLSNPGQTVIPPDRYREHYDDGTFKDFRARFPASVIIEPKIRTISTKAFYRRMTQGERAALRGTADDNINDLREDLQRSRTVNLDDPVLLSMLQQTPLTAQRITALLADGTADEVGD